MVNTGKINSTAIVLRAIFVAYIALALSYSFADRLKLAPDEPAHFIYIRSIATSFEPPPISAGETNSEESSASHEGHQPPLYYALMAIPYALIKGLGASSDIIWRILRLLTIPIGACWIYAVWKLTREFFGSDGYALAATGLTALLPTASYAAGIVNNDILVAFLFTSGLTAVLRYFKTGGMSLKSGALLGVVIGLAALTKAQGLILLPIFLSAALLVCTREHRTNLRKVVWNAAVVSISAFIICGWWFIWRWMEYGTPFPHSLYNPVRPGVIAAFAIEPRIMFELLGFLAARLWGHLVAPFWLLKGCVSWMGYFYTLSGVTLVALAGFVLRLRRNNSLDRRSLWMLVFAAALQYLLYVHYVLTVDLGATDQGRLFLSVAAVVSVCLVLGFDGYLCSARARMIAAAVGAAALLALNAYVITCAVGLRF